MSYYKHDLYGGALTSMMEQLNWAKEIQRLSGAELHRQMQTANDMTAAFQRLRTETALTAAAELGRGLAAQNLLREQLQAVAIREPTYLEDLAGRASIASLAAPSALERLEELAGKTSIGLLTAQAAFDATEAASEYLDHRNQLLEAISANLPENASASALAAQAAYDAITGAAQHFEHRYKLLEAIDAQTQISDLVRQKEDIARFYLESTAALDWPRIHSVIGAADELRKITGELYEAYHGLSELVSNPPTSYLSLTLAGMPAVELYAHSNLLSAFAWGGRAEPDEEEQDEREEDDALAERSGTTLAGLLRNHHPQMLHMWQGAKQTIASSNPDRVRHYCASQRELLLKVLLAAAPARALRQWSTEPHHYQNGKPSNEPTWRARLLYICHRASQAAYAHFVLTDATAALQIYGRLNKGVHSIDAGFTTRQLTDLQIRADNLILLVLLISIEANN